MSCAHWLAWRIGLAPGAAREKVRVARALPSLPHIDGAFERGELSYSKVRAVTRVATAESDEDLAQIAKHTTASQLERVCRRFGRVLDDDARMKPDEAESLRKVESRWTDDGHVRVTIQLPPDEGARLLAALDSARAAADEDGAGASRADGLRVLVESWFESGPRPRRGGAPHEVVMHVSAETPPAAPLASDVPAETRTHAPDTRDPEAEAQRVPAETRVSNHWHAYLENADGPRVPAETARRIACDASKVTIIEDNHGRALDVGRKSRTVPASMRRALEARDHHTCAFPGCTHTRYLDAHHVHHWANGGPTAIDNLVLLCRRHHSFVHEHGFAIERDADGSFVFRAPRGARLSASPRPPRVADAIDALAERRHAEGIEVDALSLMPDWRGEDMDYVQVLDFLCHRYRVEAASRAATESRAHDG